MMRLDKHFPIFILFLQRVLKDFPFSLRVKNLLKIISYYCAMTGSGENVVWSQILFYLTIGKDQQAFKEKHV